MNELFGKLRRLGIVDMDVNPKLVSAEIAVTPKCNLKCKHCCNAEMEKLEEANKEDLINAIEQLYNAGIKELTITGGEPLMRNDFCELGIYARKKFERLYLMSNATMITEDNVVFIANNFDGISISLDGFDQNSCEKIRGAGVFERIKKAVGLLKKENVKEISLSSVINTHNMGKEDEFEDLCRQWGVRPIIRRYAPVGRGKENSKELFSSMFMYEENESVNNLEKKALTMGSAENNGTTVCNAFKSGIYIGSDLCIYPCGALNLTEFKGDNILEIENLAEYFEQEKYIQTDAYKRYCSIKPENAHYCKGCSVYMFCNDCPAYIYLYHKYGYFDNYCKIQKKMLKEEIYGCN